MVSPIYQQRVKRSILVGPTESALRVLEISRLDSILTIVPDVEEARQVVEG